jgi:hypothetical protein
MTTREIEDRELREWKKANPYRLVNVASLGTACGRFPTVEDAKAHLGPSDEFIGVDGFDVLFRGRVNL